MKSRGHGFNGTGDQSLRVVAGERVEKKDKSKEGHSKRSACTRMESGSIRRGQVDPVY